MAKLTGAGILVEALGAAGARRVYGVPGPGDVDAWTAITRSGLQGVMATSELGAAFMAVGEARATGSPAVLLLGPGPGFAQAACGIAEAQQDGVPLVVIQIGHPSDGRRFRMREAAHEPLLVPLVREVRKPATPESIAEEIAAAFAGSLTGAPAPVAVLVPDDLLGARVASPVAAVAPTAAPAPRDREYDAKMDRVLRMLRGARRVGIYAGHGATDAGEELAAAAERLEAPVATTISGRGALGDDHPLGVGFGFGPAGPAWVARIFRDCDLVLAVGVRFSEAATGGYTQPRPRKLVHVDVDPAHLDAHATVDLSLRAEARAFLEDLSQRAPQAPRDARLRARIAKGKRKHAASLSLDLRDDGVQPEVLFSRLRSRLGADAVLVTDTGRHALWALHAFPVLGPRTLISPADFAARGFAVPAAIGARLAAPERAVVCVCSDTAFMVTGLELKTAADARLALSVLVLEEPPETSGPDHRPVPQAKDRRAAWRGVDYRALAQALGARTATANSDFDLDRALDAALSPGDRPTLCHVRIRYDRSTPYLKGAYGARLPLAARARHAAASVARRLLPGQR